MASDLGLHCLPMSHKKYVRLIPVKVNVFIIYLSFRTYMLNYKQGQEGLNVCSLLDAISFINGCLTIPRRKLNGTLE